MASCTKARMASSLLMFKTPRGLRLGGRNRLRLASLIPRTLSPSIFPTFPFLPRLDHIRDRSNKFESPPFVPGSRIPLWNLPPPHLISPATHLACRLHGRISSPLQGFTHLLARFS